jgi:hypothetical protein
MLFCTPGIEGQEERWKSRRGVAGRVTTKTFAETLAAKYQQIEITYQFRLVVSGS